MRVGDQARVHDEATAGSPGPHDREELVRRWLNTLIERSSLEELAERPLGQRMADARLLLETLGGEAPIARDEDERTALPHEIEARLDVHRRTGEPFGVALIATEQEGTGVPLASTEEAIEPPRRRFDRPSRSPGDWKSALERSAAVGEVVLAAGHGVTAVVVHGAAPHAARRAADRLRVAAWAELGSEGALADVGLAVCPADGTETHELLAVAQERLERAAGRAGEPLSVELERALVEPGSG